VELVRGLHNLQPRHRNCAATIGNLDGVHLGHQAVLGQLSERAVELQLPTSVIVFEPQPQEFFVPQLAPPRLTRFREKIQALRRFSIDRVICIRFDRAFAELTPEQFVETVLVQGLGVHYLVVGADFRFGRERSGDFTYLQKVGAEKGFQVVNMHTVSIDGKRVSSTRIREALAAGDMREAEKLLGRPYRMCGRVARGDRRGRTIGFPTANIYLHRHATPVKGVFAVEMFGLDQEPVAGVANVGVRPTVDGTRSLLEVYLFDFDSDIYGRYVHVNFLNKLRDEKRYDSLDDLKAQIVRDVDDAQAYFSMN
jgi:riboflavin kinase/FMN adenylyltransferase